MKKRSLRSNTANDTIRISTGDNSQMTKIPTQSSHRMNFRSFFSLFKHTIFIAVLISQLLFGLIQESTALPLETPVEKDGTILFSGVWTANSPKFSRTLRQPEKEFHYQAIEINVPVMGTYTFTSRSSINTYGYIYDNNFDPIDTSLNLISQDDDSDGKEQFKITALLHPDHRYILVATTNTPEVTGKFSIISSGPATVNVLYRADNITTIYSSALSFSSQVFHRPDGEDDEFYYFHAIQIGVSVDGTYVFNGGSNIDTMGYFYNSPFDPSSPTMNLITDDDDGGDDDQQFQIEVYLQAGRTYVLVVTTYNELTTGSFSITTFGPASVSVMSIIPSTSQPILLSSTLPTVSSSYSSALSTSSQVFHRPNGDTDGFYYFQAIQMSISTSGTYFFTSDSTIDTMGYFYNSPFDPSNPSVNLITEDDDSGDIPLQFRIRVYLESGRTYVLVVTTHWDSSTGSFSVSAFGPGSLSLMSITPSTSQPISTSPSVPTVTSSYSSELSSSSQLFYRPEGQKDKYYYFQAIQFTISTAGMYKLTSNSNMDTMGYFYESSFDPFNPLMNLITDDDDSGAGFQFLIEVYLEVGHTYVLVVTTHSGYTTGNFSVSAVGPVSVDLVSITASTSRPIVTQPTPPSVTSSYGSSLTFSSPVYDRPEGNVDYYYYFQAIRVTTSTPGTYVFTSKSDIDSRGYFYLNSFDPSDPMTNLITEDDDSGSQLQFRIQVYLRPGITYVLVMTTHREHAIGNFSIISTGPASVSFMSITASTSRPIVTPSTSMPILSTYAGALTSNSPVFYRPLAFGNDYHYFQALQVTVSTAGIYIFRTNSSIDTRGYFYHKSFDPSDPTTNLVTDNDDGGGNLQYRIQVYLQPGNTYILVTTTHRKEVTGDFIVLANGPTYASLTPIVPSTSRPITTQATTPSVSASIMGELSTSSSIFYRPQTFTSSYYYFQAIQVTVPTAGSYAFRTNSSIDTRGYFYENSFDPSNASVNLIADNDDGGGNLQFLIQVNIQSGKTYILVVTTHKEQVIGPYTVLATGPAIPTLTSFTPSTSRPITMPSTTVSVPSSIPGALSSNSFTFSRPGDTTQRQFYYEAFQASVSTAGTYTFRSNSSIDTRGYFYNNTFSPYNVTANLITENDDGGGNLQFRIEVYLQAGQTYILVVTTHKENVTGNYLVITAGPAAVNLLAITPLTTTSTTTTSTIPFIMSFYINALVPTSPILYRPNGDSKGYYYHAMEINVVTSGIYSFSISSSIDTNNYLYDTSFDPSNLSANLIGLDNNNPIALQSGRKYILVVTNTQSFVTGSFWVSVRGTSRLFITSITSSIVATTTDPNQSTQDMLTTASTASTTIKTSTITIIFMCMLITSILQIIQTQ